MHNIYELCRKKIVQHFKIFGWNKCQITKLLLLKKTKQQLYFPLDFNDTYSLPYLSSPLEVGEEQNSTPIARESRGWQISVAYTYTS